MFPRQRQRPTYEQPALCSGDPGNAHENGRRVVLLNFQGDWVYAAYRISAAGRVLHATIRARLPGCQTAVVVRSLEGRDVLRAIRLLRSQLNQVPDRAVVPDVRQFGLREQSKMLQPTNRGRRD